MRFISCYCIAWKVWFGHDAPYVHKNESRLWYSSPYDVAWMTYTKVNLSIPRMNSEHSQLTFQQNCNINYINVSRHGYLPPVDPCNQYEDYF